MNLAGTYTFKGPRDEVFTLLQDPDVLATALPGTKTLTKTGDDHYEGVMKVSIGPMTAAEFAVQVDLRDKLPPQKFSMLIDGKGGVGFATGMATIVLEEQPGPITVMNYTSDLQIGGRIAAVGQRLLDSVGKTMTRQALDNLSRALESRLSR
jgi:carbon monoxide dehydrogenase subunit G